MCHILSEGPWKHPPFLVITPWSRIHHRQAQQPRNTSPQPQVGCPLQIPLTTIWHDVTCRASEAVRRHCGNSQLRPVPCGPMLCDFIYVVPRCHLPLQKQFWELACARQHLGSHPPLHQARTLHASLEPLTVPDIKTAASCALEIRPPKHGKHGWDDHAASLDANA